MISLNCNNLALSFGMETILDGINFSLNEGDKLGIIGVNGAGKSSLFAMITGKYSPTEGAVYISKGKSIGLLEQNIAFESSRAILDETYQAFADLLRDEDILENLRISAETSKTEADARKFSDFQENFTANGGYEFRGRCKGVLKNLGFGEQFWNITVSSLSGGQKTRLALACMLLRDPDILLLDEPTNHLDTDALFWLESYLKNSRKTILIISHDRYFLDSTVNKILEIENTHGTLYNGNYSQYTQQKAVDREIGERHYKNQQKEIQRIEAYIEQQRRWNRERNIIAAESRQKLLDKMQRVERPENLPDKIRMRFEKSGESGNDVLTVRGLSKSYPGKPLFCDVDFLIKKHDHLFICGQNGCGKSTLIKIIAGREESDSGSISLGYNVTVGYYDQENQDLNEENTVLDELWDCYANMTETALRNTLALFLFKGDDIEKKISVLSGGEKARLTLAKLMLSKMNLLILDEPTNHLDINSREILESALLSFDGTIIAVSHDRYFVNKLATRILDFGAEQEKCLFDFKGTYPEYLSYKKIWLIKSTEKEIAVQTASKEQFLSNKRSLSDQRKYEKKLQSAKDETDMCERRIAAINAEMNGDAAFDHVKLAELADELEECENHLLELYELVDSLEGL